MYLFSLVSNLCRHTPSCDGKLADEPDDPVRGVCQHAKGLMCQARTPDTTELNSYRIIITLILLILSVGISFGSGRLDVKLEPRRATVGDPMELTVTLNVQDDVSVIWPNAADLAPAEIIRTDTLDAGTGRRSIRYTIALFELGQVELPELPVVINETDTLRAELGTVEIVSVLNPEDSLADILDIRPPVKMAWRFEDIWPYLLLAIVIIGVILVAVWLWKRVGRGQAGKSVWTSPPRPPYEVAMDKLFALKEKKLWQNGKLKEYYSELTQILKEYIGARYRFNAPELTTEELLSDRSRWNVMDVDYNRVKWILTSADLVKFARHKTEPNENLQNYDRARDFVVATKPVEVEPDHPEEATDVSSS